MYAWRCPLHLTTERPHSRSCGWSRGGRSATCSAGCTTAATPRRNSRCASASSTCGAASEHTPARPTPWIWRPRRRLGARLRRRKPSLVPGSPSAWRTSVRAASSARRRAPRGTCASSCATSASTSPRASCKPCASGQPCTRCGRASRAGRPDLPSRHARPIGASSCTMPPGACEGGRGRLGTPWLRMRLLLRFHRRRQGPVQDVLPRRKPSRLKQFLEWVRFQQEELPPRPAWIRA
mmetsp:Transcript_21142/g.53646  ORF Transcript_21142/g.53646 Transcript_21142/m.53646 type:complete len:237 (+) Transcript_21142:511-1221(+)